ncbi:MAG: Holliday junction resolvase RecU [Planctomycetaceae bacterium]
MIVQHPASTRQFSGTDFQELMGPRVEELRREGIATLNKPGIFANVIERLPDGKVLAFLIKSLPDYQGVFCRPHGREVMFDLKVCSQSSFGLDKYRIELKGARARQLKLMYERSGYGSVCFFLLHWNGRELKTREEPAVTYAFPVMAEHPFWSAFERGEEKSIKRSHCEAYGIEVPWITIGASRIPRPDLFSAMREVANLLDSGSCWVAPRAILR